MKNSKIVDKPIRSGPDQVLSLHYFPFKLAFVLSSPGTYVPRHLQCQYEITKQKVSCCKTYEKVQCFSARFSEHKLEVAQ